MERVLGTVKKYLQYFSHDMCYTMLGNLTSLNYISVLSDELFSDELLSTVDGWFADSVNIMIMISSIFCSFFVLDFFGFQELKAGTKKRRKIKGIMPRL